LTVKSFGAKGDGLTDDTAAFTAARVASKYISVPEGTYIIDSLSLQDAILFGNGTLKWKNNSTAFMLELKGRSRLEGLTLDGNGPNQTVITDAIKLTTADKTTVRNNLFTNFKGKLLVSDLALSPNVQIVNNRFENCGTVTGCDVVTVRSSDWLINGNYFSNIGDGHSIRLGLYNGDSTANAVERTIISNNHFKDTQHVGVTCEIYTRNTVITGNTFDNLEQAIKMEIAGATVYDITITGNIFRNITLSTALNLVGTKVKFTNNRCYNIAGSVLFSEYYDCSHNEFYDCGVTSLNEVITVTGSPLHGIIAKNLIVNAKYRAISVFSGIITGNRIINCADQAIRISDSAIITDNYVNGATNGVVLVSTSNNTVVSNNVLLNITSTKISYTNNSSFNTVFIKENVGADLSDLTYTLASDTFTVSMSARTVRVGAEGAAASDNLATINGGYIGQTIFLRAQTSTQVITVQDKVGNIDLGGGTFLLDSANDCLTLIWTGTYWVEVARSNNG
jgi:hypothetical protein